MTTGPLSTPARVLLVEDQDLVRESVAELLRAEGGIEVVGSASDAEEAAQLALQLKPDVVLMDIDMPGRSPFDAAKEIARALPHSRVAFLTAHPSDANLRQALEAQATGFLSKSDDAASIVSAVRSVATGRTYFAPGVRDRIILSEEGLRVRDPHAATSDERLEADKLARLQGLTRREMEVCLYIARGMSNKEIAQQMHVSVKTVESHASNLMERLDLHDRISITRLVIRAGLITP